MDKVSEISSSKLSDAIINYRQWGEMYYNVQVYGVLPDGSDVTAALQALVNKATAESRTAIFFPPGDYKVTAISNDSAVFYVGDNARFVGGYSKTINLIGTNPGPYGGPPNPHASTHVTGGTDVIPNAVAGGNSGLMSGADKARLDGVATGANNYVHPATHPPSIIAQDASNRFVTDTEKSTWNAKASAASVSTVQTSLDTHTGNTVIHVTQADRDRWDAGGGSSGPSFGHINDINASVANDTLTIAQGTGIAVSTNTTTKTVTITATGSSTPGPHASSHAPGGSDPIQLASTTQAGLAQLNDTVTSTSTTQAGTANAVKTAYDRGSLGVTNAATAQSRADQAYTAATTPGSTTAAGVLQMYDGIDSTSTTLAATANAVRLASLTGGGGSVQIGTTAAVTYYVDGTAGSDTTGTGAQAMPFKTIQFAVDKLWDLCKGKLNHDCNIFAKENLTYTEDVVIVGFWGNGNLLIRGNWTNGTEKTNVSSIEVDSCNCKSTSVVSFNVTSTSKNGVSIYTAIGVSINSLSITGSSSANGVLASNGSACSVLNCTISNRSTAINASVTATIRSSNNNGTGNSIGLSASGAAKIGKSGTQPSGTTAESQSAGGVITA